MADPYADTSLTEPASGEAVLTDIRIPFGRLVVVMLTLMLAAIPAIVLLWLAMFLVMLVVAVFFGGLGALINSM